MRLRSLLPPAILCLLLLLGAGCGSYPHPGGGEGPGRRPQDLALGPREELAVGRRAYAEVMTKYRGKVLRDDEAQVRRAREVFRRLQRASEIPILQREINLRVRGYTFEWEVNVVREPQVNAFCLPAGKVAVFTGLLDVTGGDDGFLATVLAHEMAHALAHHASERVARERSASGILRSLAYGRMQEEEADHIGVFLMAFAGYDARKAPAFWERMRRAGGGRGRTPEIFSDHPSDESRVRALAAQAPRAMAAKRRFDDMNTARVGR